MAGEGLVAVVQGFRDAGLAVAIIDDSHAYTVVPNHEAAVGARKPAHTQMRCDAGAQATDGRYATVYKVHHCKVTPTSPPVQLTEFPPQRAELCPGHGNFEVGGTGSGETGFIPVRSTCYRGGGMCWTDRGSVCTPRPSRDPDAFASSLRKYPAGPSGSTEMVERLVNYSQARNFNRSPPRHSSPPPRYPESSSQTAYLDRSRSSRQGLCEQEQRYRCRAPDDYPTRDRRCEESYRKPTFCKNSDARFVRDVSRRLRESIKSMSNYPFTQPTCTLRAGVNCNYDASNSEMCSSNSVNMQIQAAAEMVSRNVSTILVSGPATRTIAIPLSPTSSNSRPLLHTENYHVASFITRSVQTLNHNLAWKAVQTTTSSVELPINKVKVMAQKSKSFSDFGTDCDLKDEILEWLDNDTDPKVKALQKTVLRKLDKRLKRIAGSNPERFKFEAEDSKCRNKEDKTVKDRKVNNYLKSRLDCCSICKSADVCKTKAKDFTVGIELGSFEDIIKDWLHDISIKKRDFLHRPVKKDQIYNIFVNRLKHLVCKNSKSREQLLRAEILETLEEIPIELYGYDKGMYLNTIAHDLMNRLENLSTESIGTKPLQYVPKKFHVTERNLKGVVADAMVDIIKKTKGILNSNFVQEIETTEVLKDSNDSLCLNAGNCSKEEVANLLNNVIQLPVNEAIDFASQLTGHLKSKLNEKHESLVKSQTQTVLVLQNVTKNNDKNLNGSEQTMSNRYNTEVDTELDKYKEELSREIEEWLSSLKLNQTHTEGLKKEVVNGLVGDIVDRHKYLELNNNQVSDSDELEHLKYQIFKWINKLVGEDNMETVEHASELMKRIKTIPVPKFSGSEDQIRVSNSDMYHKNSVGQPKYSRRDSEAKDVIKSQILLDQKAQRVFSAETKSQYLNEPKSGQSQHTSELPGPSCCVAPRAGANPSAQVQSPVIKNKTFTSSLRPPCCSEGLNPDIPSMKRLNEEFDDYLCSWVKQIPIAANTQEEEDMADKARLGIHHGVWKAITKMKFNPAVFQNQFYYEDLLEEEIDELLDLLPQTQELKDNRYMLKAKLIEKITDLNELIKAASNPASYKEQLMQEISCNLPRLNVNTDEEDPKKLYEDMMVLRIAEDFILSTKYKNEDKIKADAYRNKIKKTIGVLFEYLKKVTDKEYVENLDYEVIIGNVFALLHKVPLPSEESIREEADEILLGQEIDQWLTDLPIAKNDDETEQLHRRRLRDALVKKLHEMEKETNVTDCYGETLFKHEISMFLAKVPLEKDESLNINFMVDELTNRMKNRDKTSGRRKSVAFRDNHHINPLSDKPNQSVAPCSSWQQSNKGQQAIPKQIDFGSTSRWDSIHSTPYRNDTIGAEGYHNFSMERPACSSMINTQPQPPQYTGKMPDFRTGTCHAFDDQGNKREIIGPDTELHYVPGQFYEENLGGGFGCLHGSLPFSSERYGYPDRFDSALRSAAPGPPNRTFFNSQGNYIPAQPGTEVPMISEYATQYRGLQNINFTRGPIESPVQQTCPGMAQNINSVIERPVASPQGVSQNVCQNEGPAYLYPMDKSSFKEFSKEGPPCSSRHEGSIQWMSLSIEGQERDKPAPRAPSPQRSHFGTYVLPPEHIHGGHFGFDNTQAPGPCQQYPTHNSLREVSPPKAQQLLDSQQEYQNPPEQGFVNSRGHIGSPKMLLNNNQKNANPHQQDALNSCSLITEYQSQGQVNDRCGQGACHISGIAQDDFVNAVPNFSGPRPDQFQNVSPHSYRSIIQEGPQNRSIVSGPAQNNVIAAQNFSGPSQEQVQNVCPHSCRSIIEEAPQNRSITSGFAQHNVNIAQNGSGPSPNQVQNVCPPSYRSLIQDGPQNRSVPSDFAQDDINTVQNFSGPRSNHVQNVCPHSRRSIIEEAPQNRSIASDFAQDNINTAQNGSGSSPNQVQNVCPHSYRSLIQDGPQNKSIASGFAQDNVNIAQNGSGPSPEQVQNVCPHSYRSLIQEAPQNRSIVSGPTQNNVMAAQNFSASSQEQVQNVCPHSRRSIIEEAPQNRSIASGFAQDNVNIAQNGSGPSPNQAQNVCPPSCRSVIQEGSQNKSIASGLAQADVDNAIENFSDPRLDQDHKVVDHNSCCRPGTHDGSHGSRRHIGSPKIKRLLDANPRQQEFIKSRDQSQSKVNEHVIRSTRHTSDLAQADNVNAVQNISGPRPDQVRNVSPHSRRSVIEEGPQNRSIGSGRVEADDIIQNFSDPRLDQSQNVGRHSCCQSVIQDEPQDRTLPRPLQIRVEAPTNNEASSENAPPASFRRSNREAREQRQNLIAADRPASEFSVSDQPVGFSTPNRRIDNCYPPNIKVRRQIEKERNSRRTASGTDDDDDDPRFRCQCMERIRCRRYRSPRIMYDNCMGSHRFCYPDFPMGYPYPHFCSPRY